MPAIELRPESIERFLASLLQHELTLLRPGRVVPPAREWSQLNSLYHPALAVDSLERLHLASAVSEVFHLYETLAEDRLLRSGDLRYWVETILNSRKEYAERFSFRSSGSSSRPKLCMHDWRAIEQEVREWAGLFSGRERIVSFVPCHHIYGFLFTVLLPAYMGIPVVDTRFEDTPRPEPGDLVVSFPDHLQLLAASGREIPRDIWAVSSTARLRPSDAAALRKKGLETLVEIYGCSEAGGIAYRYHAAEAFELLPYYDVDPDGEVIRRLPDKKRRGLELPDHLRWVDARAFHVMARKDEAVQVSGINVYPRSISERITAHPFLSEAHIRLGAVHGSPRLKAMLVFADARLDTPKAREEIVLWMRGELRAEEFPAAVTFSASTPRNELGKLIDWPIRDEELLVA